MTVLVLGIGGGVVAALVVGSDDEPSASQAPGSTAAPSEPEGSQTPDDVPTDPAGPAGEVPVGLEDFYGQQVDWSECGSNECGTLTVPVDYTDPDGETIELNLERVLAGSPDDRVGSLVVNPGGPGGSGVDYASAADFIVGPDVRRRYDVVGFDPRGVGRSAPVDCLSDAGLDDFLGTDPTPDDAAEEEGFADASANLAKSCAANAGALLGHVSTVDAAKDMDILRAALGDAKLNFLGKSYGTYLGATYADLFPQLVGQFVLDGVVAPDLTSAEVNQGQAEGFELATRAWAKDCVEEGDCPLGGSVDEVMEGMRAFLEKRKPSWAE